MAAKLLIFSVILPLSHSKNAVSGAFSPVKAGNDVKNSHFTKKIRIFATHFSNGRKQNISYMPVILIAI